MKTRVYGHNKTLHGTTHIDVETDKKGNVIQVWFRCQPLPFKQIREERQTIIQPKIKIHAIVIEDTDGE